MRRIGTDQIFITTCENLSHPRSSVAYRSPNGAERILFLKAGSYANIALDRPVLSGFDGLPLS
jgi:hypothetical protein